MQQFTVPQFIDVESKIIGPITTRQFIIFLGAAVLIGLCYRFFDFSLFITFAIIIFIVAAMFAFVKINGRPFHFFILNAIQTIRRPNLRIWNNNAVREIKEKQIDITPVEAKPIPKEYYKTSHLAEVALIVDTQGRYKGE
ncbi:MAG TPA: PrgI family protein [Candidatus Saccharimonadales bacterium]|nr:PrgI family protein [Candidatus Saccharimonadales bacterium]